MTPYSTGRRSRLFRLLFSVVAIALLAACGSSSSSSSSQAGSATTAANTSSGATTGAGAAGGATSAASASGGSIVVGLITKTETNPFFVKMKEGAQAKADQLGAKLLTGAGSSDGDNEGQVTALENMVNAGAKGVLI